jgi:hypothetical protein
MPATMCQLCTDTALITTAELEMQACQGCADRIGLIPMPPSRRPPAPCGRCNSRKFLRVIPREHTTARAGEINRQISVPMYVTHSPTAHVGWVLKHAKPLELENSGHGLLETYICQKCGAVEWYCVDVERIPVHPHLMSEEIDYENDAPYR